MLLDDELPGLTYLKMLCEQIPELKVVRSFNNAAQFLNEIPELEFDLCILDIEIPNTNGLEIARLLKEKPVIFTTAFQEYAAEAFDLDAIDYVRKPIRLERLQLAVHKAIIRIRRAPSSKNYVELNTDKGRTLIFPDQLCYVRSSEIDSRDKVAQMQNHSTYLLKNISFEALLKVLPSGQFCQINKKELIALSSVSYFSHDIITTNIVQQNGKPLVLIISDTYRKGFIRFIRG